MAKAQTVEGLNCADSAADNIRLVLCARLDEMCGLRAEALNWSDVEGVHDMRVASRRLRSALKDFKPYMRLRKLASFIRDLKRIADALGAVRDQDVVIPALEELQLEAPAAETAGLTVLIDERRAKREKARTALASAIDEEALSSLRSEFVGALEKALTPRRHRAKKKRSTAALSFGEVAPEVILARLEELRDLSPSLSKPFAVDALHAMRIAAKRLRYAMQLFATCLNETLAERAEEVSKLQTSLGKLHDCDVWLEGLGHMLRDFQDHETGTEAQKQSAAVWLQSHFARARMKHYGNALACWHEWERDGFVARLTASLDARPATIELSPVALTAVEAVAADTQTREPS